LSINYSAIDKNYPLVDLHRHLDGNIRPATIWELAKQHHIALPAANFEELISLAQIQDKTSDLLSFLAKLDVGVSVLADLDAVYRIAWENVEDVKNSALDYAELRFSPYYMSMAFKLNMSDVVAAVVRGVKDSCEHHQVKVNLIGILSRTFGVECCATELQALLAHQQNIVALDLAGDERGFPATLFVDHFKLARDAGWQVTVHAGEADGPLSIWHAIKLLGASRIGHGVAAIEDEALITYMAENAIAIESCPTSNYQTGTIRDISQHPLATFVEKGLLVTLNTDDPGVSNIDIANEYSVARDIIGLSTEQLKQIQLNGLRAAFISASDKQQILQGIKKP
jgi:adenosine deaminase